jgi:hypothetical protein
MTHCPPLQRRVRHGWLLQCCSKLCLLAADRVVAVHRMGYNVFQSDVDTVYMKDALRTLDTAINTRSADAVFMTEGPLNGGNWYARNTPEIRKLFKAWQDVPPSNITMHDQAKLSTLNGKYYRVCNERVSCTATRKDGLAPIYAHPIPLKKDFCVYAPFDDEPCDPRRLYLHAVCISGVQKKVNYLIQMGMWFVNENGTLKSRAEIAKQAPYLPCTTNVTWAFTNM